MLGGQRGYIWVALHLGAFGHGACRVCRGVIGARSGFRVGWRPAGGFGCYFSGVFCWYRGIVRFCRGASRWAISRWGLGIFLIFSDS